MSKVTRATLKSFIRKNEGKLFIKVSSRFDGMVDGVRNSRDRGFTEAMTADRCNDHNLGIQGAWLVLRSNDWFTAYDDGEFTGIEVYNSCGTFVIATKN